MCVLGSRCALGSHWDVTGMQKGISRLSCCCTKRGYMYKNICIGQNAWEQPSVGTGTQEVFKEVCKQV